MVDLPDNGRRVSWRSPEADEIRRRRQELKERGEKYPSLKVDDFFQYQHFWIGQVCYKEDTYEVLYPTKARRSAEIALPPDWIIDGEKRLPREKQGHYEWFLIYRDLGPERTIGGVEKVLGYTNRLHSVAVRNRWKERVQAYDTHMEVEARKAAQRLLEEQMAEEVQRRATYLNNEWAVVEKGFGVVNEMLKYPVVEQESVKVTDEGKTIITVWKPGKWTYAAMAQLIEVLTKVGRYNTGLSVPAGQKQLNPGDNQANKPQMSAEEAEMHDYASRKAEDAYFAALDEWKAQKADPHRQPPMLKATVAA
jgi:hypothetical protein